MEKMLPTHRAQAVYWREGQIRESPISPQGWNLDLIGGSVDVTHWIVEKFTEEHQDKAGGQETF